MRDRNARVQVPPGRGGIGGLRRIPARVGWGAADEVSPGAWAYARRTCCCLEALFVPAAAPPARVMHARTLSRYRCHPNPAQGAHGTDCLHGFSVTSAALKRACCRHKQVKLLCRDAHTCTQSCAHNM